MRNGVVDDLSVDVGVAVGDPVAHARDRRPRGSERAVSRGLVDRGDALHRGRQPHAHGIEDGVVGEVAPLHVYAEDPQGLAGVSEVLSVGPGHIATASRVADERT